jgi:dipeptidyl aminopeptidase/acylaminoacyl peptidase
MSGDMRFSSRVAVLAVLLFSAPALAQPASRRDGDILERTPCPPYPAQTYASYQERAQQVHREETEAAQREGLAMRTPLVYATREEFEQAQAASRRVDCTRVVYSSDGLKVVAFMWRPKALPPRKVPLIIFNRGGNREFGKVVPWQFFHRLAAEGFVMLASQYRGNDGGEGREEFGGADVRDILNLIPLAQSLDYVDANNVFMLGWSRGAMMTLLAVKQGMKVNAVAIGGSLLDLVAEGERRPALAANVWSELMPGFATRRHALLQERSPLYWPELIDVPVLIMHGTGDWRASAAETLTFAQKLQTAGKTYELVMYANDDHGLSVNRADSNRRILEWFNKHIK